MTIFRNFVYLISAAAMANNSMAAENKQTSKDLNRSKNATQRLEQKWVPTEFFYPSGSILPKNYNGVSAEKLIEYIILKSPTPKGEFETSEDYKNRIKNTPTPFHGKTFAFQLSSQSYERSYIYNPDIEVYYPSAAGMPLKCDRSFSPRDRYERPFCLIGSKLNSLGKYTAQNGFGISITVDKSQLYQYGIILNPNALFASGGFGMSETMYYPVIQTIEVPIEKAKSLSGKTIGLLMVGTIANSEVQTEYQHIEPKIDKPTDLTAVKYGLSIDLERLVFYVIESGEILKQSFSFSSVEIARSAAERGDMDVQEYIGESYYLGKGEFPRNKEESIHWFKRSAEQGGTKAQRYLGIATLEGDGGLTKDPDAAIQWFKAAAKSGDAISKYYLGQSYLQGWGSEGRNETLGHKLLLDSAEGGYPLAQTAVAKTYIQGTPDVPANNFSAVSWLKRAAQNGDSEGQYLLGIAYLEGKYGLETNRNLAFNLLGKSNDFRAARARRELGIY